MRLVRLFRLGALFALAAFAGWPGLAVAQVQPPLRTDLSLRPLDGFYNQPLTPGQEKVILLEVRNNGTSDITNIVLGTRNTPAGWVVDIRPGTIARLTPNSARTVDVAVTPPANVERGNYNVTVVAEATETRTATGLFMRVERTSSLWLWVGGAIGAAVVAGFVIVFLRFGRH